MVVDVAAIKAHVDLLDLIGRDTPLKKAAATRGGEFAGPCPFCGGRDRFRVWPRDGDGHWWCRACGLSGDAVQYLRQRDGLDFRQACQALSASVSELGAASSQGAQRPPALPSVVVETPPSAEWRAAGMAFVERSKTWLRDRPDSRAAQYLARRGIQPDTAGAWQLGCQSAQRPEHVAAMAWGLDDGKPIWIPRGIVLPWLLNGELWHVKIRRPDADLKTDNDPKYTAVRGGRPVLFGIDNLVPGFPAVVVESELDAVLLWQEVGDQVAVVATGGVRGTLGLRALQALTVCSRIIVAYDADDAGHKHASDLLRLGPRVSRLVPPLGKDPTEFKMAGGDLRAWLLTELANAEGSR